METIQIINRVKIVNKSDNPLPSYAHEGDSGMDIRAFIEEPLTINPNETKLVHTGVFVALPKDYEFQVRSRSGLALKSSIHVLNSPGTVDEVYRGEIGIILHNSGEHPFIVNSGDRVAQIVLQYVPKVTWEVVEELDDTKRGAGGYGHTGI